MKWRGRRGSRKLEDRRGKVVRGGGGMSLVAVLIVLGLGYFFGIDVTPLLQGGGGTFENQSVELTEADRRAGEFVSVTLADTEEVWADIFRRQVGDDTLQRNAGRIPQPHTFTHGTSVQRQRWFATGFDAGDVRACDTFSARSL